MGAVLEHLLSSICQVSKPPSSRGAGMLGSSFAKTPETHVAFHGVSLCTQPSTVVCVLMCGSELLLVLTCILSDFNSTIFLLKLFSSGR